MGCAKEGEVYLAIPSEGGPGWTIGGVFCRDTCYFSTWEWSFSADERLSRVALDDRVTEFACAVAEDRSQTVEFRRQAIVNATGFADSVTVTNHSAERQGADVRLEIVPRLIDLFALRHANDPEKEVAVTQDGYGTRKYHRVAADGVVHHATVSSTEPLPPDLCWSFDLAPGDSATIALKVELGSSNTDGDAPGLLPSREEWRTPFARIARMDAAVARAVEDLRTLLLPTAHGPYPAAGLPIFSNFFGRDALITGIMLLPWVPRLLGTVLNFLADHQGRKNDAFREEEPGKIMHEMRRGELSRTDRIPFGRYYGSVDATPLFLMAADEYHSVAPGTGLNTLQQAIVAATDWLVDHLDGPTGLATFRASGSGLTVQSWKDSAGSMVDEHGRPAKQPLAVAEVQGYAYAALLSAARLLPDRRDMLVSRADTLRQAFHSRFWLPEISTYAMALDGDLRPLRVLSSDPGHLLWAGIVPDDIAAKLVATLLSDDLWSGWGIRTLGANEKAYNPVSYHNGSVWPHDTGIFAMGLQRYGFHAEARKVAHALLDVAAASPQRQMPELISGYGSRETPVPVPYTHANAPQAWSAATVIRMAAIIGESE